MTIFKQNKHQTPVILSDSVKAVRGGLTRAMFTRANTLAEEFDRVVLLTFMYQQNHKDIIQELNDKHLLNKNVEVHNMFEDLAYTKKPDKKKKVNSSVNEKGYIIFKDEKQETKPSYRYYENGLYVMYKRFDEQGNLQFIDYMNDARYRTRREEYSKDGYLLRSRHMDIELNKTRLDRYFDRRGNCFLTAWVNPETAQIHRVTFFGQQSREFKSLDPVKKRWVDYKIKAMKNPVIMTDARSLDPLSLKLKHDNIKRIAIYHNNHYKKPYDNTAEIRDGYKTSLENLAKFDKVVFLTEEQKADISHSHGDHGNYEVIPHAAPQHHNDAPVKAQDYDPYKAVTLARYSQQKRIDEAIEAFQYVVEQIPQAKYHIYGFGDEKRKLQNLINELGLQDNVTLKGFADNASAVYKSAACSILTSHYEGFGMVLTESLSYGTPTVSYDSKYGPSDIIRDNVDGFLIPKGNKEELAARVIDIMTDEQLRKRLSANALEVNKRFSSEDYAERWTNLLKYGL